MRLYIAGPMTGLPEFNYPAFFAAAKELEDQGFTPINPARAEGRDGCKTWLDFMRASLRDLSECDGIATLPGWSGSSGAVIETTLVKSLGLPVRELNHWLELVKLEERPPAHVLQRLSHVHVAGVCVKNRHGSRCPAVAS